MITALLAFYVFRMPAVWSHSAVLLSALPIGSGPFVLANLYGLQANVTQSHIHFAQRNVNGGIVVWLCGTATNPGPAGTQTCPQSGTITGTIHAGDAAATQAHADLGYQAGDFPTAEAVAREVLSLPIFPEMTKEMITHTVRSIRSFDRASTSSLFFSPRSLLQTTASNWSFSTLSP